MGHPPRHPFGVEVAEYSVNQRLVSGVGNVISGREPTVQRAERPDLLRFTGSVNRRCDEADSGARDGRRAVSYDRGIASRNRRTGAPGRRDQAWTSTYVPTGKDRRNAAEPVARYRPRSVIGLWKSRSTERILMLRDPRGFRKEALMRCMHVGPS